MGQNYNPLVQAQAQFDVAAEFLELDNGTRQFLRQPAREYHFTIPVRMDDGRVEVFNGYRVQHNDARGPAKGGIRFHPHETADTIRALSMWMTWKCALINLPLGGGKGGIICDPRTMSEREQERLCRGYIRALYKNVGPNIDVPAPDVMTTAQHMIWMLDEYETIMGGKYPGMITGKPVEAGGSLGRKQATGFGIIYVLAEALKDMNIEITKSTASIQGFGNVGEFAAVEFTKRGGRVVAVSCWDNTDKKAYTYYKKDGINIDKLVQCKDKFGSIDKTKVTEIGCEILDGDKWISLDVDILLPCALENQITADNVESINKQVKIICEGANGPTSPEADAIINKTNINLLPDFLCNAGGVTCSYFEQIQGNSNYYWGVEEVLEKLNIKMVEAFAAVNKLAKEKKVPMREAAYLIAVSRVVESAKLRGHI